MSETSQGPDWWLASDGKWYPPESRPDYRPGWVASTAPPPMEHWQVSQDQLGWKAEQRKRRYDDGPPSPRVVLGAVWRRQSRRVKAAVLGVLALVVLLVAGALSYQSSHSGPSATETACNDYYREAGSALTGTAGTGEGADQAFHARLKSPCCSWSTGTARRLRTVGGRAVG